MLEIQSLSFSYNNGLILKGVSLSIKAGQMVGLLGPNGAGKSTLLRLTSGVLKPREGQVKLNNSDLRQLRRSAIAREVAVVPQEVQMPFAFTVREMVFLGRTPYLGPFATETESDWLAVERALELTDTGRLADRIYNNLSMGERQRVLLAMALAQEPRLLLLDEPTAHLDISHQIDMLELLREQNHQGLTVMAAMHDLNLAALYFERLVLLSQGSIVADGPPAEVLKADRISQVFKTNVEISLSDQGLRVFIKRNGD